LRFRTWIAPRPFTRRRSSRSASASSWKSRRRRPAPTRHAGFGAGNKAFFWIGTGLKPKGGTHVAFTAKTRAEVDAFYRAAIAAGGRDNGPPGPRSHYHPHYYGAFVFDPDGNNIEAVCHKPG
jgi:catechol 2,3-dioxygenase-like lactoylglutathione lyase family enzyme